MSAHLREAWRALAEVKGSLKVAMRGPIYRGFQVNLPPDLKELVEKYSALPMEMHERGQHTKIGRPVVEWLQKSHPGGAYSEGLGLGRHWTTDKRFAEIATTHGNVRANWPILLTAQYDEAGVDPEPTMTTERMQQAEDEVTLLPGARVTVTAVEMPGAHGVQSWGNLLDSPVEARA